MKEQLRDGTTKRPLALPVDFPIYSADNKPMRATITDEGEHYALYLYIISTEEKAKILEFYTPLVAEVVFGEIERKCETVFAHVVHQRQHILYTAGEGIYDGIPPMEVTK